MDLLSGSIQFSGIFAKSEFKSAGDTCGGSEFVPLCRTASGLKLNIISFVTDSMSREGQLAIIKLGVAEWNRWRHRDVDRLPDLSKADLSGTNLSGVNLDQANLKEANLCEARLVKAKMGRVRAASADLSGSDVSQADLESGDFTSVDLSDAKLCCTCCKQAKFNGAVYKFG